MSAAALALPLTLWSEVVGLRVRVETTFEETIEGEVYCFDLPTHCVILSEAPPAGSVRKTYRLLNVFYVRSLQRLSPQPVEDLRPVRPIDMAKLRTKEAAAIADARKEASRIGVGVSPQAQLIFNALSKTLPCRWDNDTIVIFDDLRILSPHRVQDVKAGSQTSQNELNRVKRVLEGETRRLGLST